MSAATITHKIDLIKNNLKAHFKSPPKMKWSSFVVRAILSLVVLFSAAALFASRFTLAMDYQTTTSIQGMHILIIDRKDTVIQKGNIYAFKSPDLRPFYPEGVKIAKFNAAGPGDVIKIDENDQIWVNGKVTVYRGLEYAKSKLGVEPLRFRGETILKDNQYWMLGDSPKSFDSRYWGPVGSERIIGRAYKII